MDRASRARLVIIWTGILILLAGCNNPLALIPDPTPTVPVTPTPEPTVAVVVDCRPTPGQFSPGVPSDIPQTSDLAPPELPGERMIIAGTVYASDCITPLPDAVVEVRHADSAGNYDNTEPYTLLGRMFTNADGRYEFSTIKPSGYRAGGASRPAHIHYRITANDGRFLSTQLFFAGDPLLAGSGIPPVLIAELVERDEANGPMLYGTFDIVLPVAPPTPAPAFTEEDL
ncbi:MAG: hypothetical protein R3264_10545 [Anaerolineae bacterium]|nr:hypothetical protein [Anaerolineae bacterium]